MTTPRNQPVPSGVSGVVKTLVRGVLAVLVAVPLSGLGTVPTGAVPTGVVERAAVNRVVDTVLRGERYDYQRESWRVSEAEGLPRWLHQRRGRLTGTAPRLGRWRIVLAERGVGKQRGESRRTVLVLRSVTERAAPGTVLVSRGLDGGPANNASTKVTISGGGSTVVFSSFATNLVPGTKESVGRVYVWDASSQQVSLLHPEAWARILGISRDGQRVLVGLSAGVFLLDRTDGSQTQVATRTATHAALTADGERVVYRDAPGGVPSRLVEWTRAIGATRTVVADLGGSDLVGVSSDGRLALLTGDNESELLDTTTGEVRGVGRLGVEGGYPEMSSVSDDGRLLAIHGSGTAAGHGRGGDRVDVVQDGELGGPRGPRHNPGAAITPDGTHYVVATATRHLRVVDVATGARTSPFLARPGGEELGAALSDDASRLAYVSDASDLLHGTRRGVANVYVWAGPR